MPRRKISMGLIPNRRLRVNTFAKRQDGLKKKARELAALCACDGTGAADVWESDAGVVLDAYRHLPSEERAKHTHVAYAEAELYKAETKLVRVRQEGPPALAPCDAGLYELSLGEAQRVLGAVDEALRAVNERRAALGLPLDDDGILGLDGGSWLNGFAAPGASDALGLAAPSFVGSDLASVDGYVLRAQGSNTNEQEVMWDGGFDPCSAAMNWQPGYAFQQCTADMGGYKLQQMAADMYANNHSIGCLPWDWDALHPTNNGVDGYRFECAGTSNSYVGGMPSYLTQQQVPSNAVVSLGFPTGLNYVDTAVGQPGVVGDMSLAGGNFHWALSPAMANCDNFIDAPQAQPLAVSYNGDMVNAIDYASQWATGNGRQQSSNEQAALGSIVIRST
jgi:hypothetical protein